MISTKSAVDKTGDNCGGDVGKRGITGGVVRQIGCEKIKLSETINFMAGMCHLLGASGIVLARGTERGTADAGEDDEGRVACGQRALHGAAAGLRGGKRRADLSRADAAERSGAAAGAGRACGLRDRAGRGARRL